MKEMLSARCSLLLPALLLLSVSNIAVILPALCIYFHADRAAGHSESNGLYNNLQQPPSDLPPLAAAALARWRHVRNRNGLSDTEWSNSVIDHLWCGTSIENHHDSARAAAVGELLQGLTERTLLDRRLAAVGCRRACDNARRRVVAGANPQPDCGNGLCVCDGGLSYGLEEQAALDEPGPAFFAAQALLYSRLQSGRGNAARPAAAPGRHGRGSGGLGSVAGGTRLALDAVREQARHDVRRYEWVHAEARRQLSAAAANYSLRFASKGQTLRAQRARICAEIPFEKAFRVTLKFAVGAPAYVTLGIALRAVMLECRRRAGAFTAGDTFVIRSWARDVVLQTPVLRELNTQPNRVVYTGALFVAEAGSYVVGSRVFTTEPCCGSCAVTCPGLAQAQPYPTPKYSKDQACQRRPRPTHHDQLHLSVSPNWCLSDTLVPVRAARRVLVQLGLRWLGRCQWRCMAAPGKRGRLAEVPR